MLRDGTSCLEVSNLETSRMFFQGSCHLDSVLTDHCYRLVKYSAETIAKRMSRSRKSVSADWA